MTAAQIKERLPLRDAAAMVGIDLPKDGVKFHSPFRPDKNPSCSVTCDLFTDWSSGEHLDSIGFFAAAKNISCAEAIRELRLLLSGEANRPPIIRPRKPPESPKGPVEAPDPIEPSLDLIQQAAKSRGLSVEAFEHARMTLGTLRYSRVHGQKCWVLSDSQKIGWEARRCDGKTFDAVGELHERKSHSKGRGLKKWPVGLVPPRIPSFRIALKKPRILLVEGGPDYIAACELILGLPELILPCAMLGKSASISDEALPHFQNRHVTIAGHPDARERIEFWARQIADAGAASVHPVLLGLGFDLNDHLRNHPHRIVEIRGLLGLAQPEPSNTDLGKVIPLHSRPNGMTPGFPISESIAEDFSDAISSVGAPFILDARGRPSALNSMFVPTVYASRNKVLFDGVSRTFYEYSPPSGLWISTTPESVRKKLSDLTFELGIALKQPNIAAKDQSSPKLEGAYRNLAALTDGKFSERPSGFVHCTNGMLDVRTGGLLPFGPEYKSRNATPFEWNESASCPRFIEELLCAALDDDDIEMIRLYVGMTLMGRNLSQKILLLTGTPGGGKSSLCKVIEGLIGPSNFTQLRTEHLAERFELARLVGKTLLTGKDVPGHFLMTKGASVLKALSGGDFLTTETKRTMQSHDIEGDFCIIVTSNSRLRVRLDGDTDAWRRRLLIVNYERAKPAKAIPDFTTALLTKEGAGILKWAVDGAKRLLELDYAFPVTPAQQARVDSLLFESDALRNFVSGQIVKSAGDSLATTEIVEAFFAFCDARGWASSSIAQVERELPDAMMELHRAAKSSSVERYGKSVKGYRGVKLVGKQENGTDGTACSTFYAYEKTVCSQIDDYDYDQSSEPY